MPVTLIGAPVGTGAGRSGTEAGPRALRLAGIRSGLAAAGKAVHDLGDLRPGSLISYAHPNPALKALPETLAWTAAIHEAVRNLPIDQVPVILGGDHSLSLGSVPGLAARAARYNRPFFLLWIDAHPDCHTLETSRSGHLHGTPVAYALGRTHHAPALPAIEYPVAVANLCMIGIRDVDTAEAEFIAQNELDVWSPDAMRARGMRRILTPWLRHIQAVNGLLHVSLDADALDPTIAPGVGTPVEGGLALEEIRDMLAEIGAAGVLGSMDLVEVNPFLDRDQRTAKAMVELALAALSGTNAMANAQGRNP